MRALNTARLVVWGLVLLLALLAPLLPGTGVIYLVVIGLGLVGYLLSGVVGAETRRHARWAHRLTRFCGNATCGICRSRRLSNDRPRCGSERASCGRVVT